MRSCMYARIHCLPLTLPPSASAVALPAPSLAHHFRNCCLLYAMRGVRCAVRDALPKKRGRPTGINQLQARMSRSEHRAALPLLRPSLPPERQHRRTTGTQLRALGAERCAARPPRVGGRLHKCTVRQAATNGGVPANCAVQLSLPNAPTTCFHIHLAGPETVKLRMQFG